MKKTIELPICFLDFDGTIVDNKYRLYKFYEENINPEYKDILTIDEFWSLKKSGINELEWINKTYKENFSLSEWNNKKIELLETEHYLKYEKIFDYSTEVLRKLKDKYYLVLVTRRENKENLYQELNRFDIRHYFDDIIVLKHSEMSKSEYIENIYEVKPGDILVGDTEDDINSGVKLGVDTYLTLSGIRGKWIVKKYGLEKNVSVIEDIRKLL